MKEVERKDLPDVGGGYLDTVMPIVPIDPIGPFVPEPPPGIDDPVAEPTCRDPLAPFQPT